jgi:hypothetical protein
VKVVDFGIARAVEALRRSVTDAGMVKGKMSYVAPELLDGKTADARSDVFSLGVVLHELLSGRQLFVGDNDLETLRLVREMAIPLPSARNPGVKRALDNVVMRALERDPEKRYQSAGAMGDDLETVVMRERYSTRALARKARELADREEEPAQHSGPIVEETIEVPDSGAMLISESDGVPLPIAAARSSSSPVAAEAIKKPATPPRLPPGASAPAAAAPARTVVPRWIWGAVSLPTALALALLVAIARRPPPPPPPPPAAPLPSPTVHIALDSTPQGATVTNTLGSTLGETPLLIDLPRGAAAVDLVLNKTGYLPLTFKVLPHQDREVSAALEHVPPPPPPEEPVAVRPGRRGSSARRAPLAGAPGRAPMVPGAGTIAPARTVAVGQPRAAATAPTAPAARPATPSPLMRR